MKRTTVGDVMTRKVVVAAEDAPFKEIAQLMAEYRVSGLPVLDSDEHLVGIVSEGDLLAAESEERDPSPVVRLIEGRWLGVRDDLKARDVMMRDVITIGPDELADKAAREIVSHGVKRLPVVDDEGHVLGIVSRTDLLRPYLRDDEAIRKEIQEDVILETMLIEPSTIEVRVEDGMVTLEGTVETKSTMKVLEKLVHHVNGVVGVKDRLSFSSDDRPAGPPGEAVETRLYGRGSLAR